MKHTQLLSNFSELLAQHSRQIAVEAAMQHFDSAKVSEQLVLGLLREICGFRNLRNLNAAEKVNYPGLDLLDKEARVGVQVTATPTLDKIKNTIETCKRHGLDGEIDRLIVYVLTDKQSSYSQPAIDRLDAKVRFDVAKDVVDYRDLARFAGVADPQRLTAAVGILEAYLRGVPVALSEADFDPPASPLSEVALNLLAVKFPARIFVADIRDANVKATKRRDQRKRLREVAEEMDRKLPSDFVVRSGKVITFHDLEEDDHPFKGLIDPGTITPLSSREFHAIDPDHESTFKSLLRFALQQKLYQHRVMWQHEDGLFVFLPEKDANPKRRITWSNKKKSTRTVFERKRNNKDPSKTLNCKHLAFAVDFVRSDSAWYVALAPDWFFSYGDDYRRSRYADKPLSWLKRHENNQIVAGHFRFLCAWLKNLDGHDLFSKRSDSTTSLSFADAITFANHPPLDDEQWLPVQVAEHRGEGDMFGNFGDET